MRTPTIVQGHFQDPRPLARFSREASNPRNRTLALQPPPLKHAGRLCRKSNGTGGQVTLPLRCATDPRVTDPGRSVSSAVTCAQPLTSRGRGRWHGSIHRDGWSYFPGNWPRGADVGAHVAMGRSAIAIDRASLARDGLNVAADGAGVAMGGPRVAMSQSLCAACDGGAGVWGVCEGAERFAARHWSRRAARGPKVSMRARCTRRPGRGVGGISVNKSLPCTHGRCASARSRGCTFFL